MRVLYRTATAPTRTQALAKMVDQWAHDIGTAPRCWRGDDKT